MRTVVYINGYSYVFDEYEDIKGWFVLVYNNDKFELEDYKYIAEQVYCEHKFK